MGAFKSSERVAQDPPRGARRPPKASQKRPKRSPRGRSQEAPNRALVLLGVSRKAHESPPDLQQGRLGLPRASIRPNFATFDLMSLLSTCYLQLATCQLLLFA